MTEPPNLRAHLEQRVRVDQRLDDAAHVVDLAPVARHGLDQPRLAPRRIVGRRRCAAAARTTDDGR